MYRYVFVCLFVLFLIGRVLARKNSSSYVWCSEYSVFNLQTYTILQNKRLSPPPPPPDNFWMANLPQLNIIGKGI